MSDTGEDEARLAAQRALESGPGLGWHRPPGETQDEYVQRRLLLRGRSDRHHRALTRAMEEVGIDPRSTSVEKIIHNYRQQVRHNKDALRKVMVTEEEMNSLIALLPEFRARRFAGAEAIALLVMTRDSHHIDELDYIKRTWDCVDRRGAVSLAIRAFAKFTRDGSIRAIDLAE